MPDVSTHTTSLLSPAQLALMLSPSDVALLAFLLPSKYALPPLIRNNHVMQ